jgi:putative Ca2+/H+ antiporter (TMEM165/GDT1 family)
MIPYVQWATLVWLTCALIIALRRIIAGDRSTILLVFLVFYAFFALPLLFDLVLGSSSYLGEPGFVYAERDDAVNVIYCLFIALVPLIWSWFLRAHKSRPFRSEEALRKLRRLRLPLVLLLFMPIALIWWAPDPALYLKYAFAVTENLGKNVTDISQFHSYVMASTVIVTIAAAALVGGDKRPWRCLMLVAPCVAAAVWLNGKRSVLAVAVIMMMTGLWLSGRLRGRKILIAAAVSVLLIASFSYWYQLTVRGIDPFIAANSDVYENFRIDYARDSRVKMAIFAELHPSTMSILEFRGQSLIFYATAYIPRTMWPGKPLTYACYFTSAMLGSSPQDSGWGMTTSIFDEAIANGSWLGLLAASLVIGILCRIGDSCSDVLVFLLTAIVASLLLTVELVAFAPLVLIWVTMIVRAKVRLA